MVATEAPRLLHIFTEYMSVTTYLQLTWASLVGLAFFSDPWGRALISEACLFRAANFIFYTLIVAHSGHVGRWRQSGPFSLAVAKTAAGTAELNIMSGITGVRVAGGPVV